MGWWATQQRLYLASIAQIWRLENVLGQGQLANQQSLHYERLYVPRMAQTTGDVDAHELAIEGGEAPAISLILCGGATILRRDLKMRKEPYGEGRNARISGSGDRTPPQRHLQGEARERTRDHRPYGGTNAQEPYQGACRRQGSGRDDTL